MNRNKAKGDRAEMVARDFFRLNGFPGTERTRAGYTRDFGDLHLSPGALVQVKDCQRLRWSEWFTDLEEQIDSHGADVGFLMLKRPRMGSAQVGQWLAVMPVERMTRLVRAAGYGTPLPEDADSSLLTGSGWDQDER